jgi:Domain of unknown function (DUF5666)
MRGLGRRTGWLGWAVAGVLLLSAGGAALAAQGSPSTTQAPGATADRAKARTLGGGQAPGWRRNLARRALHGEVTVQTADGVKTFVLARGEVSALAGDSITVKSSDGVSTSFRIDGSTRFGFRREPDPRAELKVGDDVWVVGQKSGGQATATNVVSAKEAPERAGRRAGP